MRQTSRVISPILGIKSALFISLTLVALDDGDLSSQEAVAGPELSTLGSAGHHPTARCLLNPAFGKVEP